MKGVVGASRGRPRHRVERNINSELKGHTKVTYRTVYLTHRTVMTDGKTWSPNTLGVPVLPQLLARLVSVADRAGMTVMFDQTTHTDTGLPERLPKGDGADHPALEAARSVGWRISRIDPWMTFWRPGSPSIHVGVRPWLNAGNFKLHDTEPVVEQIRLNQFHTMLGTPYHGSNAGLAGIDLLRDHHRGKAPMWTPGNWDRVTPARQTVETVTDKWRTELPDHGHPFEHSFDARLQFLGAAMNAKLAVGPLQWAHPNQLPDHGPVLPGYYLVTVPSWAYRDRIPHPLGDRHEYNSRAWITGATLELVNELAERDQVIVAPEIHEAWIAVGGQMLKGWAEKIRDAEHVARMTGDPVLHDAVKNVYKAAIGLMKSEGAARVFRPDWQQTIVGLARSNLWRKMWREGKTSDVWPVEIHADAVWYPGHQATPTWPATFRPGLGLGCFNHEATREVTR